MNTNEKIISSDKTSPQYAIYAFLKNFRSIMNLSTLAMLVPFEYEKTFKISFIDTMSKENPVKEICEWGEGLLGGIFAKNGLFVANDLAGRKWNVPYFKNPINLSSFLAVCPDINMSADSFFILCLERKEKIPFSTNEIEGVRNLVILFKNIIENSQKFDKILNELTRSKQIFNINTMIQESTTIEDACEGIIDAFSSLCNIRSIFLTLWNSFTDEFEIQKGSGKNAEDALGLKHRDGDDFVTLSTRLNRPLPENGIFRENFQSIITGAKFPWIKDGDPLLVVPFVVKSRPLGAAILVGDKDTSFSKEIIESTKSIAIVASNSLQSLKIYEILEKRAITDELTGLYNKRNFLIRLDEIFADSLRHNRMFALLMGDLDHFKKINDEYGHITGDRVLKSAASIIKETARKSDIVSRYGGEEFAVILPETDLEGGKFLAERIRQVMERTRIPGAFSLIDITISFGASSFPRDGKTISEIIDKADKALYRAKKEGRNKVCI